MREETGREACPTWLGLLGQCNGARNRPVVRVALQLSFKPVPFDLELERYQVPALGRRDFEDKFRSIYFALPDFKPFLRITAKDACHGVCLLSNLEVQRIGSGVSLRHLDC